MVTAARERMTEILGNLQTANAAALSGTTIELHIIPHDKKLTDLPEYSSLKGTKTFDGRLYDDLRGAGGTKTGTTIRYAIAEEQLVGLPKGTAIAGATGVEAGNQMQTTYSKGFIAAHESGHILEQYALTKDQTKKLQELYDERTKAGGPWLPPASYTSSRKDEYFAQSVAAFFGHPYSDSAEDKKVYTRAWLEKNDPKMCVFLATIFK